MEKKKYGWTALGIVGIIFASIGAVFNAVGGVVLTSKRVTWKGTGDPAVFTAVFCGMGGLFLLLGLAFLFADLRRRHLLRRAYEGGNRVDAQITDVSEQGNVNMNGRHPCVVECAWTDASGVVHIYRSRYLYVNVKKLLKSDTVPLYIDRYNENIGFVDVDAVLPEIRVH